MIFNGFEIEPIEARAGHEMSEMEFAMVLKLINLNVKKSFRTIAKSIPDIS